MAESTSITDNAEMTPDEELAGTHDAGTSTSDDVHVDEVTKNVTDAGKREEDQGATSNDEVADDLRISSDELSQLARQSADAAAANVAADVAETVRAGMDGAESELSATVTLSDTQYGEMRSLLASDLQTSVVCTGVCSLILGAVVGVALTLHWRGGRG